VQEFKNYFEFKSMCGSSFLRLSMFITEVICKKPPQVVFFTSLISDTQLAWKLSIFIKAKFSEFSQQSYEFMLLRIGVF